jgi:hypothetical protein
LRIRVGDYRIVYSIDDDQAVVDVIRVPHRSKAYAGLFATVASLLWHTPWSTL